MSRTRSTPFATASLLGLTLCFLPGWSEGPQAATPSAARVAAASGSWQEKALERLQLKEYEITWQTAPGLRDLPAAYQAPNRAHGFRTYFTGDGIRMIPRTAELAPGGSPSWEWSLTLAGYGRSGKSWTVPDASLSAAGDRMEYARGAMTEWYVNDRRGLKQGFALPAPPEELAASIGRMGPALDGAAPGRARSVDPADLIHLDLALAGNLRPVIAADGQAIDFETPTGARVVRYAELLVVDATGRVLPSWMEGVVSPGLRGIRIVVDAAEAIYPVTVDPLATSPGWTAESDQDFAWFGFSVATAGDVDGDGYSDVIVGAQSYDNGLGSEGAAFVYQGSASGLAASPAWMAAGDQAVASFGGSVSTAGDVNSDGYSDVIIGASEYDNGQSAEGAAFVYLGSASGLAASPAWSAEGNLINANFGFSVAAAGDVNGDGYSDVIVGASEFENGQAFEGAAFVYLGSASGLAASPAWSAEGDQVSAIFGHSVATAGDVDGDGYSDVIVGARAYDNGQTDEGAAFVYLGSASGLAASPAWSAEGEQGGAWFGSSVGTAGDVDGDGYSDVIVGARNYGNGQSNEGAAFVYRGSAAGLAASPSWSAEGDQAGAGFGSSVATAGDLDGDGFADVIVGAWLYDLSQVNEGAAFVYRGSAAGLSISPAWSTAGDQTDARLGNSVATAGDVDGDGYSDVIIGAYQYTNGQTVEGAAFVYHGSVSGLATGSGWSAEADQAGAGFGFSVATAGDVDGDGHSDVIVGADSYDNGQADEGAAFLYLGSVSGLAASPAWMAESDQTSARLGASVATAGDVNGDGYSDVIVGARLYDNGQSNEGAAFVYHGSASGLATGPAWSAESDQADAYFGTSVATAGDVNGDGYSDVIVGAPFYDNVQLGEGAAYVYHGSALGLAASPAWMAESDQAGALFGTSVATAGDVDGDGYSDVIIGAVQYANGQSLEGGAFVYHGSASGLAAGPGWSVESDQANAKLGVSVATAGDVDGDGYSDVIVGAYEYANGQSSEGSAFVYHGSVSGLAASAGWSAESNQNGAYLGYSVATAGDVNGDGFSDVIVGAYEYANGEAGEGAAFVYLGSASGLAASPSWTAEGDQAAARLGLSVSTAGDIDGDGYADVIAGAYRYDNGEADEGSAFVFHGNGGPGGLHLLPQQRRGDGSAPVLQGLRSRTPASFRLAVQGRTPFGRGRVKLRWEVKPRNHLLDGSGTMESAQWMDTGTAGVALDELVSSLDPGDYHWRVRLLYDPATTPLQPASRWFTVPSNGWNETDIALGGFLGGMVWEDRDGDGIRDPIEPPLGSVLVYLLDGSLTPIDAALTLSDGSYWFELAGAGPFAIRVIVPSGYFPTLQDQGGDDLLDSDVNVLTGETPLIGPPYQGFDATAWSAGLREIGPCEPPDEPLFIYNVRLGPAGETILDFQDFNQPSQVTGYNVYRTFDPAPSPSTWPLFGLDVVDGDEAMANKQWADTSLEVAPGGIWYYDLTAYNNICGAEGPF